MGKKICIQAGHSNIKFNSIQALQGSTGAPQEVGTNYAVACKLSEILRAKGFEVKQTDANANDDPAVTAVDWDLFLALHCDADSKLLSGGFVDTPDPSVDVAHEESARIATAIESMYFANSGIVNRPERKGKSDGVLYYYMWQVLTVKTPCVLVEMGESIDPHDRVILNDTVIVANAIARGVCKAFNVSFDVVTPTPVPTPATVDPCVTQNAQIVNFRKQILDMTETIKGLRVDNKDLTEKLKSTTDKIAKAKDALNS